MCFYIFTYNEIFEQSLEFLENSYQQSTSETEQDKMEATIQFDDPAWADLMN